MNQSIRSWATNLDPHPIARFSEKHKRELIASLEDDPAVPLRGLTNAWCTSWLVSGGIVAVNIVATIKTGSRIRRPNDMLQNDGA